MRDDITRYYQELTIRNRRDREMEIYCCGCGAKVDARLTSGAETYPHRADLHSIPFWKCDGCGNFVGCHHKTSNPTHPLGNIPTRELKKARQYIHALIDPLWQSGKIRRKELYSMMSDAMGWSYHTAKLRSIDEAREAYRAAKRITKEIEELER